MEEVKITGKDVPKRIIEAAKTTPFFTSVNYR